MRQLRAFCDYFNFIQSFFWKSEFTQNFPIWWEQCITRANILPPFLRGKYLGSYRSQFVLFYFWIKWLFKSPVGFLLPANIDREFHAMAAAGWNCMSSSDLIFIRVYTGERKPITKKVDLTLYIFNSATRCFLQLIKLVFKT